MKKIKPIQQKAAFLLIAFSLNTIIGFACAIGMNMGFNSYHHEEAVAEQPSHHHSPLEHDDQAVKDHHQSKDQDNCCHDKVTKISQLDKAIPQSFSTSVNFIFLYGFASAYYNIDLLNSLRSTNIRNFVRRHYPPIPDIRIAIQSFQI
ncbi:MAG: hypothetical protein ACTHKY_01015 [Ginsengibacter sp.]